MDNFDFFYYYKKKKKNFYMSDTAILHSIFFFCFFYFLSNPYLYRSPFTGCIHLLLFKPISEFLLSMSVSVHSLRLYFYGLSLDVVKFKTFFSFKNL